jgi:hypothetical protein
VEESLKYGLPSSETAFIAVYQKSGKRIEATALVPNALPDGWSEQFENKCYSYGGSGSSSGSSTYSAPISPGSKSRKFRHNSACGIIEEVEDAANNIIAIDGYNGSGSFRKKRSVFFTANENDIVGTNR